MRLLSCLLAVLHALAWVPVARADIDIRVGSGANCATASIQAAINAANNINGTTNILIARNTSYNTNWLNITGKNVRLIGGYADCDPATPRDSVRTPISGAGGSQDSVIKVRGSTSTVAFYNLELSGGDATDPSGGNHGGGVEIEDGPHNLVYFENVWIHDNEAIDGGGLWIKNESSSNPADINVWLSHNTRIYGNQARRIVNGASDGDGGGIWCSHAVVYMTGGISDTVGSYIAGNNATDAGGGIRAENCRMYIATTSSTTPTISGNVAGGPGGGISVTGGKSLIGLYTQNPLAPTMLYNNVAGGVGGAIDIGSSAQVHAWDIIIWNNTSRSGGGAVSVFDNDDAPDALFRMKGTLENAPDGGTVAGGVAVNCAAFHRCNRIVSNAAIESGGTRRPGAAIRASATFEQGIHVAAVVAVDGTEIVDNSGENLLELAGDTAYVTVVGAAMINNNVSAELLHAPFDFGYLRVLWSTIAGNSIGGAATFRSSMDGSAGDNALGTRFKNSIHWQPGKRIYSVINGTVNSNNTDFLLANDLTGVPASTHNLVADPQFVDSAARDYHLKLNSPAVDYAASANAPTADHLPRLKDLAVVANNFGPQDLGAYERQFACGADTVFCNGFEF